MTQRDLLRSTLHDPATTAALLDQVLSDASPTLPPPSYSLAPETEEQAAYAWLETL